MDSASPSDRDGDPDPVLGTAPFCAGAVPTPPRPPATSPDQLIGRLGVAPTVGRYRHFPAGHRDHRLQLGGLGTRFQRLTGRPSHVGIPGRRARPTQAIPHARPGRMRRRRGPTGRGRTRRCGARDLGDGGRWGAGRLEAGRPEAGRPDGGAGWASRRVSAHSAVAHPASPAACAWWDREPVRGGGRGSGPAPGACRRAVAPARRAGRAPARSRPARPSAPWSRISSASSSADCRMRCMRSVKPAMASGDSPGGGPWPGPDQLCGCGGRCGLP